MSDAHLGFAKPDVERAVDLVSSTRRAQRGGSLDHQRRSVRILVRVEDGHSTPRLSDAGSARGRRGRRRSRDDDRRQSRLLGRRCAAERRRHRLPSSARGLATSRGGTRTSSMATGCVRVEDKRYRALRRVLRNPLAIRSFRWLHPDLATPLAIAQLATQAGLLGARRRARAARRGGCALPTADASLDLIVFGHSHVATLERLPTGSGVRKSRIVARRADISPHHRRIRRAPPDGKAQPRVRISTPSIVPPRKRCPSCRNCSGSSEAMKR